MAEPIAEDIAAIAYTKSGSLNPLHEVMDEGKVAALVAGMEANGWQGPPVVVDGENAFTGSHRIAAHVELWNEHGIEVRIERVEITDLCELYGIDWSALLEDNCDDTYEAATALKRELPREVVDYLGFDVDGEL